MQFNIEKQILLKSIALVENIIPVKSLLPILSNLLLEATEKGLILRSTNLDTGISATIPDLKIETVGSITIPAKKFFDIIKELPNSIIFISMKKNNMLHITCENSQFKIMGASKDDFPQFPEFKSDDFVNIKQLALKTMLNMTSFAICKDETRYMLNGVYMVIKKNLLRVVTTDGRRLALIDNKMDLSVDKEKTFIIPAKTVKEIQKNLKEAGEVAIVFGDNQIMFNLGDLIIISRLIEGEFPAYEQVIPKEIDNKIIIGRNEFLAALKRASIITTQDSLAIKIGVENDKMTISKNSPDIGEMTETLNVKYNGPELSMGFNPYYLIDVLENLKEDVIGFELENSERPGVIRTKDNYIYVVLPMQLA